MNTVRKKTNVSEKTTVLFAQSTIELVLSDFYKQFYFDQYYLSKSTIID